MLFSPKKLRGKMHSVRGDFSRGSGKTAITPKKPYFTRMKCGRLYEVAERAFPKLDKQAKFQYNIRMPDLAQSALCCIKYSTESTDCQAPNFPISHPPSQAFGREEGISNPAEQKLVFHVSVLIAFDSYSRCSTKSQEVFAHEFANQSPAAYAGFRH